MKRIGFAGRHVARYLLVGAMSVTLIGCGGSSGDDDDPFDPGDGGDFSDLDLGDINGDVDGDGTPNSQDDDYASDIDGDGILNGDDPDFDGTDIDGDGFSNLEDRDVDGDGVLNEDDDDFVENDADGDGFTDPTAGDPCGSENGSDAVSENNDWGDNCVVSRFGQFRNSLYTAGIQRVVYCSGFGEATNDRNGDGELDVDDFADGDMGPATAAAIDAYQGANGLTVDTTVGPGTWGSLQDQLEIVDRAPLEGGFDSYTVAGDRCGGEVLFYQEVGEAPSVVEPAPRMGWTLAASAGSDQRVPFSTELTRGRLQ